MAITNYYIDYDNGDDANAGTAMSTAWKTVEKGFEDAGPGEGDYTWIRRGYVNNAEGSITPSGDGRSYLHKTIGLWPRESVSGSAYFTSGTKIVTGSSLLMTEAGFLTRYMHVENDAQKYQISLVSQSGAGANIQFHLNKRYGGETGTKEFYIEKDELYEYSRTVGATADQNWDDDTQDIPICNFNGANALLNLQGDFYFNIHGLYLSGSGNSTALVYYRDSIAENFTGCIFDQGASTTPTSLIHMQGLFNTTLARCYFRWNGGYVNDKRHIYTAGCQKLALEDCIFADTPDHHIYTTYIGELYAKNCNFGCDNTGTYIAGSMQSLRGHQSAPDQNLKFTDCEWQYPDDILLYERTHCRITIENYQRILNNDWQRLAYFGSFYKNGGIGSGIGYNPDIELRPGGSPWVYETHRTDADSYMGGVCGGGQTWAGAPYGSQSSFGGAIQLFEQSFMLPSGSHTLKYYCLASGTSTRTYTRDGGYDRCWFEAEHMGMYRSNNDYSMDIQFATGALAKATSVSDWSQFMSCSINIPYCSGQLQKVTTRFYCGYPFHFDFYIDPKPEITTQ